MSVKGNYPPFFIPRLPADSVPASPSESGDFLFIDESDSKLKLKDYAGAIRVVAGGTGDPSTPEQPENPEHPDQTSSLTELHPPGQLNDGDQLFVLKTPQLGLQRVYIRMLPTGRPVFVIQTGDQPAVIKENEYVQNLANNTTLSFATFIRPLVESNVFASLLHLSGAFFPNRVFPSDPTGKPTGFVIDSSALVTPVDTTKPETPDNSTGNPGIPVDPKPSGPGISVQRLQLKQEGTGIVWGQIPPYQVPDKGVWPSSRGTLAEQVEWVRKGSNFISLEELVDQVETRKSLTPQQAAAQLAALNLPASTGVYGMIYQGAFHESLWDNPQQVTTEGVYGFLSSWVDMRKNKLGWKDHRMVIDLDFERAPGTWIGLKTVCDAIVRIRKNNPEVEFLYYASNPNNLWGGTGGDEKNPYGIVTSVQRHQMLKAAGVKYYDGAWYFHGGVEAERLIGTGKPFRDGYDFAERFLGPIEQTIRISDDLTAWPDLAHIDWVMEKYEGNIAGTKDWPLVGGWILESLPLWGQVQGKFRAGGGILNWGYDSPVFQMSHIEAGKWRAFQFNRFWNDPSTVYNIKPDFSFDGGKTWHTEAEYRYAWDQVAESWESPRPYIRAAALGNEILVVGVANRKTHVGEVSQKVRIRHKGWEQDIELPPLTVTATVYQWNQM